MRTLQRLSLLIGLTIVLDQPFYRHVDAFDIPSSTRRKPLRYKSMMSRPWRDVSSTPSSIPSSVRGGGEGDASSKLSYYLLWSPTMFSKTVASFVGLLMLRHFLGDRLASALLNNSGRGSFILTRSLEMILIPLLSSACCSIQLIINVMVGAGGCAGFNKHLGPLRPYFLGILLSITMPTIFLTRSSAISWTKLGVQLFLAFLPELLFLWNYSSTFGRSFLLRGGVSKELQSSMSKAEAEFNIPGMGGLH